MVILFRIENPVYARQSLCGAAEKQAHVWPTLPLQPHSTCFSCICRRRHSTSRPIIRRPLSYASPVPRLQLTGKFTAKDVSLCFQVRGVFFWG